MGGGPPPENFRFKWCKNCVILDKINLKMAVLKARDGRLNLSDDLKRGKVENCVSCL